MSEARNNAIDEVGPASGAVRVCRICGSPNPQDDNNYCINCWLRLDRPDLLPEEEAVSRFVRRRRWWLRNKPLILAAVVVLGLVIWQAFVVWDVYYLLAPSPTPVSSVSADAGPGNWGQAGGTPQNSSFVPEAAPAPDTLAWTFAVPGARSQPAPPRLISPPVISDGRVYLTTEDGRAIALEQATGEVIWEYVSGLPGTASPAIGAGLMFFGVRPGNLYAVDRDSGELRWFADQGSTIVASPVVEQGRLFIGTADHKLHALEAASGEPLWDFTASSWIISSAAYADDTLVVTTTDSMVHVLDAKNGREKFIYDTGRIRNLYGGAAILDDKAFLPSHRGVLTAIDRGLMTQPLERKWWGARVKVSVWWSLFSPPVQKGTVWISSLGGRIVRTPAAAHNTVYASVQDGRVVALDADTGNLVWDSKVGARTTTGPSVAGDTVLVGTSDGRVVGLDARSGQTRWEFEAGGTEISSKPIVSDGMILAASKDGILYALTSSR